MQDNKVAVRRHGEGDKGVLEAEKFVNQINEEIKQVLV
jgi:threonyl-tRNA synthetase